MSGSTLRHGDYVASVVFDPDEDMFRGEVINTASHIDFYADSVEGLKEEFTTSIRVYLDFCEERGIKPERGYSGKFNVRLEPDLHARAAAGATSDGMSLNAWVASAIQEKAERERS